MAAPNANGLTVIKKKKRKAPTSAHGGGWKVAMADLMISMMCLFLILWLLSIMDTQDQEQLINYFQKGELQPTNFAEGQGNSVSPITLPELATSRKETDLKRLDDSSLIEGEVDTQIELEALSQLLEKTLEELNAMDSVNVQITPQGLKVTISDSTHQMFYRSSANMTPYYQDLILHLAPIFRRVPNSVIITGHTDAARFQGSKITNWELSANRANQARYFLTAGGVPESQIFQVTGMAETAPIYPEDPRSSQNRRIEMFILTASAQKQLQSIYKVLSEPAKDIDPVDDEKALEQIQQQMLEAQGASSANQPPQS